MTWWELRLCVMIWLLIVLSSCKHSTEPPLPGPDTTSHNIAWEVDTLGNGASILFDVAIINDTLAYAVGQIYLHDSLGNLDPNAYNAAKWNGAHWELKRIRFIGPCVAVDYPPLMAIWAFSQKDILVTNGGSIVHYDGTNVTIECGVNSLLMGAIMKIYAVDPQDFYVVGRAGSIARSVNGTWQRLMSGTSLDVEDIYGARNPQSGAMEILAVASNPYSSPDRKILQISGNTVTTLSDSGIQWPLGGVWFDPGKQYYVVGSGIYQKNSLTDSRWRDDERAITTFYAEVVRGTAENDVFVAGDFGELLHYNGSTWRSYMAETTLPAGLFHAIAVKGDLIFAVGQNNPRAIVARGRRLE